MTYRLLKIMLINILILFHPHVYQQKVPNVNIYDPTPVKNNLDLDKQPPKLSMYYKIKLQLIVNIVLKKINK